MTKLTYYTASTLDGFLADPTDSLAWLLRQDIDEHGPFNYEEFIATIGAIVMGSTTYMWLLRNDPGAWPYRMPTWVMTSRSLTAPDGADVRFASGDVRTVFTQLTDAAGGKDLWVVGGGDLAGQFADAGLLDEIVISVAPVVLGAGRQLLPRRLDLELIETSRNQDFVCARYRVQGPLTEDR
ncbi:dihydrofolate reductase family protein [Brooklawnia sp.]|uniref:dihydrofolate reductase family protein n=1 Tax=Brooklawnia sp. TaxID=2699740 RepID=UPI00311F0EA3